MAELERKDYQVWGKERTEALRRFEKIMKKWRLKMPPVEPQVLDFGLGRFYDTGLIEFWIANEEKEGYCGKFLFVFNGQTCPDHHHKLKHETFFVLKGCVMMKLGEKKKIKSEGMVLVMPQKVHHSFTGMGNALLLEVSKSCKPNDNIFEDRRIGKKGIL